MRAHFLGSNAFPYSILCRLPFAKAYSHLVTLFRRPRAVYHKSIVLSTLSASSLIHGAACTALAPIDIHKAWGLVYSRSFSLLDFATLKPLQWELNIELKNFILIRIECNASLLFPPLSYLAGVKVPLFLISSRCPARVQYFRLMPRPARRQEMDISELLCEPSRTRLNDHESGMLLSKRRECLNFALSVYGESSPIQVLRNLWRRIPKYRNQCDDWIYPGWPLS